MPLWVAQHRSCKGLQTIRALRHPRQYPTNDRRDNTLVSRRRRELCVVSCRKNDKSDSTIQCMCSYLGVALIEQPSSLVLIQSCNRHAIRAKGNRPSDANVCRALFHNRAFIFITYDPQITQGKQSGNGK